MPAYDSVPTLDYITELEAHLTQNVWATTHENWQSYDNYIWGRFSLWGGPDQAALMKVRGAVRPPTAASIIDHAVDALLLYKPTIHRDKVSTGESGKSDADTIENWASKAFEKMTMMDTNLTWKQVGRHFMQYGYAVLEGIVTDPDEMDVRPAKPQKKSGESAEDFDNRTSLYESRLVNWFPYRMYATHPGKVLMDPWTKEPKYALKKCMMYAHEVEALSLRKRAKKNTKVDLYHSSKPFTEIEVWEYWNQYHMAVIVKDGKEASKMLSTQPNAAGFVPFAHAYAGFGSENTSAQLKGPRYLAVGMLEHLRPILKALAESITAFQSLTVESAYPKIGTKLEGSEAAQKLSGDVADRLRDREDIWFMERNHVPPQLIQVIDLLMRELEFATYSRQAAGFRETGVTTVGQQAMLTMAVFRKFQGVLEQMNFISSIMGSHLVRMMDMGNRNITLSGTTLKPEMLRKNYSLQVRFEQVDPVIRMGEREMSMAERREGLISAQTYRQRTGLENEAEERKRLDREAIRELPEVKEILQSATKKEMGLEKAALEMARQAQERASEEAAVASRNGGPPGAPMPPGPLGPPMAPEQLGPPMPPGQPMVPGPQGPPVG
jgi:hypothetical protein